MADNNLQSPVDDLSTLSEVDRAWYRTLGQLGTIRERQTEWYVLQTM